MKHLKTLALKDTTPPPYSTIMQQSTSSYCNNAANAKSSATSIVLVDCNTATPNKTGHLETGNAGSPVGLQTTFSWIHYKFTSISKTLETDHAKWSSGRIGSTTIVPTSV
jgi:hypothetical protein